MEKQKGLFKQMLLWVGLILIVVIIGIVGYMIQEHLNPPIYSDPPVEDDFKHYVVL